MRSPLGTLLNKTPVPYVGNGGGLAIPWRQQSGATEQMGVMGSSGALFAIVNRTSNAVAQVNWRLYRKSRSGLKEDRTEVTAHAALDLLNKPNRFFTRQELFETSQQHVDLTGEGWWVIARNPMAKLPLELWPVRPDRMTPIPSPTDYLVGYVYTGPDGEQVPLGLDDVIFVRMPNPMDAYRGMGPVQTALIDIGAEQAAAEWNRNFFRNSAEPGGIVEIERRLSQAEFEEHLARWGEQHRGVSNAHRVALLEGGMKWVDRKYTNRDMEFTSLRSMSTTKVREAFGMPKFAVGDVEDINRATAEASKAWFAEQLTCPRLERWKGALNNDLLRLYNATDMLEFDYDTPVPPDAETENAERASKTAAATQLVAAGFDPADVLSVVGLPDMAFQGPAGGEGGGELSSGASADLLGAIDLATLVQKLYLGVDTVITWQEARELLAQAGMNVDLTTPKPGPAPAVGPPGSAEESNPQPDTEPDAEPEAPPAPVPGRRAAPASDLATAMHNAIAAAVDATDEGTPEREDWQDRLDDLLVAWVAVVAAQRVELADQLKEIVKRGTPGDLADLAVSTDEGAALLEAAMIDQATAAGERTAADADTQGVTIEPAVIEGELAADLSAGAAVTAKLLGSTLSASAGREALRVWAPGMTADEVAAMVDDHLAGLSDAALRAELGGEIWAAENEGRFATFALAALAGLLPEFFKAEETRDTATCPACKDVDGKRYLSLNKAQADYPFGGYRQCAGRSRCRGTVVATWK